MRFKVLALLHWVVPAWAMASEYLPMDKIPAEVKPFIEQGTLPIAVERADLNGDGRQDFVLVLEPRRKDPEAEPEDERRPLLILVREANGRLKQAKRNDKIVLCSACGGVMGDPFQGVTAKPRSFDVSHYGGSRDRWGVDYTFNYSRRDDTWQLVRVKEYSYDAFDPDKQKTELYTPPKAYGKIDIADFDPNNWKGQGQK